MLQNKGRGHTAETSRREQDQQAHINILKLQAAFLTVQTFLKTRKDVYVLLIDNTVTYSISIVWEVPLCRLSIGL